MAGRGVDSLKRFIARHLFDLTFNNLNNFCVVTHFAVATAQAEIRRIPPSSYVIRQVLRQRRKCRWSSVVDAWNRSEQHRPRTWRSLNFSAEFLQLERFERVLINVSPRSNCINIIVKKSSRIADRKFEFNSFLWIRVERLKSFGKN